MNTYPTGLLFDEEVSKQIRNKFYYVDEDPQFGKRLFFENSGGSLRLKDAVKRQADAQAFPDCPERVHNRSLELKQIQKDGIRDIMEVVFGAKNGELITEMTASQVMFQIVGAIMENCGGDNAITSVMEHPSAFDAVDYYCRKTGKELKVAKANPETGRIEVEEIERLVTPTTTLISIMCASNITGAIMDMEGIVKAARKNNPDVYIVTDAVQHIPHCAIDVEALKIDGCNFGAYKFFGIRGMGYGYVSDRVASLPHRKIIARDQNIWELGSPTPGNFASMSAVVEYVCWIGSKFTNEKDKRTLFVTGMKHIHLHERALLNLMLEGTEKVQGLRYIPGVKVYADDKDLTQRDFIVAMGFDGMDWGESVIEYRKRGVIVFERLKSSPYSKKALDAIHTKGAIRVSPLHCHTKEDIEQYLEITKEIAESIKTR